MQYLTLERGRFWALTLHSMSKKAKISGNTGIKGFHSKLAGRRLKPIRANQQMIEISLENRSR
jgi:hypothetical protein